jgi:hypothetical protein
MKAWHIALLSGTAVAAGGVAYVLLGRRNTATAQPLGAGALAIATTQLASATEGVAYNYQLAAVGGQAPYIWSAQGLPQGLSASSTGAITGTPKETGNFVVTLQATDSSGQSASVALALTVSANPGGALAIPQQTMGHATVGVAYSYQLQATGGQPPYAWTVSGLGVGLAASGSGLVRGTPTAAATLMLTLKVTDSAGTSAVRSTSFLVKAPSTVGPTIPQQTLPTLTVGQAVSFQLTAVGGQPPYTWSAQGLPPGLGVSSSGILSGTPNTAQGSPWTAVLTVTDGAGNTASRRTLIYVHAAAASSGGGSSEGSSGTQAEIQALQAQVTMLESQLAGIQQAIAQDQATYATLHAQNVQARATIATLLNEIRAIGASPVVGQLSSGGGVQ